MNRDSLKVQVELKDIDEIKEILNNIKELVAEIDEPEFVDKCGNNLKNNIKYIKLINSIKR